MLPHRVQATTMPIAPHNVGNCSSTENTKPKTFGNYSDNQPITHTDAVNCSVTQHVAQAGADNYHDSQLGTSLDNANDLSADTGQYMEYRDPPPVIDTAQYNSQQTVNDYSYNGYQHQQYISNTSPSYSISESVYNSSSSSQQQAVCSKDCVQPYSCTSQDAKEGEVRLITEQSDSLNKLSVSPQKSPLGSPSSDGGTFSFTDMIMAQKFSEGVTEQDLLQVDTFYRSHKSEVYVCGCLVNMYFGPAKAAVNNGQWDFSGTGILLLLLDTGKHHRARNLYIILAEKGSGFTKWRDVIDNQTDYRTPNANFHTMHTSKDYTQLAGFTFDDAANASEFYSHIHKLTADHGEDLPKIGKSAKKKSIKDKKKKMKLPKKTEISQPCCFVHVTKLDRPLPVTEDSETRSSKSK